MSLTLPPFPPKLSTAKADKTPPRLTKTLLPVWTSKGVGQKPSGCLSCPFRNSGSGFVPDWYPDEERRPQIGFLLDHPGSDDVLEQRPWAGKAGWAWEKKYLEPFQLSR